ncbi:hypothetical protein BDZ89DRAFT_311380 [Hymenopellis radicata]|nr:hypothetical protein BDZ89DRAFT_311380 [Hymenopellis radicata]
MLSILSKGKHKYPIMIRARRCSWLTYRASIFRPSACRLLFSETLAHTISVLRHLLHIISVLPRQQIRIVPSTFVTVGHVSISFLCTRSTAVKLYITFFALSRSLHSPSLFRLWLSANAHHCITVRNPRVDRTCRQQSSKFDTSREVLSPRTSVASRLLTRDWNPSWLPTMASRHRPSHRSLHRYTFKPFMARHYLPSASPMEVSRYTVM